MSADPSYGLQQELRRKRPRWGAWATIGWGVVIAVVQLFAQTSAALLFIWWWNGALPDELNELLVADLAGPILGVATLASTIAVIAIVILAIRMSHVPIAEYLSLKWPSRRNLLIGLLVTVIMLPLADFITAQSGQDIVPEFMTDIYGTSQDAGPAFLFLLALTLIVFAPLGEEVVFRGFLFRGLSVGLGPFLTIILTSLIWAGLHAQYNPIFMAQIFFFGIILGWIRWRSDSLILVIFLHAVINLLALAQIYALSEA